jgi:hypothetical protein
MTQAALIDSRWRPDSVPMIQRRDEDEVRRAKENGVMLW